MKRSFLLLKVPKFYQFQFSLALHIQSTKSLESCKHNAITMNSLLQYKPETDINCCIMRLKCLALKVLWKKVNINVGRQWLILNWNIFSSDESYHQHWPERTTKDKGVYKRKQSDSNKQNGSHDHVICDLVILTQWRKMSCRKLLFNLWCIIWLRHFKWMSINWHDSHHVTGVHRIGGRNIVFQGQDDYHFASLLLLPPLPHQLRLSHLKRWRPS